jgi:(2Fe-2S) ferredoxin
MQMASCGAEGQKLFGAFRDRIARKGLSTTIKVTATGCLTPCNHGPNVAIYPGGIWYCGVKPADVDEIIDVHLSSDGRVDRLLLPTDVRIL